MQISSDQRDGWRQAKNDCESWRPHTWALAKGRRVCLGQNIAVMQMKKVIPMLVLNFDIELADPHASLDADFSPAVACLKPLMVRLSPVAGEQ